MLWKHIKRHTQTHALDYIVRDKPTQGRKIETNNDIWRQTKIEIYERDRKRHR